MDVRPIGSSQSSGTAVSAQSPVLQPLADTPVGSGMTVAAQTANGQLLSATSTVTGTLFTPEWLPSTVYRAGQVVFDPSVVVGTGTSTNALIQRIANGTSRASYDATEAALWTAAPTGARVDHPIRWNTGILARMQCNGGANNYGWYPRAPKRADAQELQYAIQPTNWSVDFDWYTAAGALEVPVVDATQVRFIVDGKYAARLRRPGPRTATGRTSSCRVSPPVFTVSAWRSAGRSRGSAGFASRPPIRSSRRRCLRASG
jgi:hypothetical protein